MSQVINFDFFCVENIVEDTSNEVFSMSDISDTTDFCICRVSIQISDIPYGSSFYSDFLEGNIKKCRAEEHYCVIEICECFCIAHDTIGCKAVHGSREGSMSTSDLSDTPCECADDTPSPPPYDPHEPFYYDSMIESNMLSCPAKKHVCVKGLCERYWIPHDSMECKADSCLKKTCLTCVCQKSSPELLKRLLYTDIMNLPNHFYDDEDYQQNVVFCAADTHLCIEALCKESNAEWVHGKYCKYCRVHPGP